MNSNLCTTACSYLLAEAARYAALGRPQEREARLRSLSALLESDACLAQDQRRLFLARAGVPRVERALRAAWSNSARSRAAYARPAARVDVQTGGGRFSVVRIIFRNLSGES